VPCALIGVVTADETKQISNKKAMKVTINFINLIISTQKYMINLKNFLAKIETKISMINM